MIGLRRDEQPTYDLACLVGWETDLKKYNSEHDTDSSTLCGFGFGHAAAPWATRRQVWIRKQKPTSCLA
jgi:hypothetical protein